jgi:hypothetical protein
MFAAVLSLTEIMSVATCSTLTLVPSGSFWSTPEGRLLTWLVTVSGWSQRTVPARYEQDEPQLLRRLHAAQHHAQADTAAETRGERFEFGLDCLLDGIAARLPAVRPSRP